LLKQNYLIRGAVVIVDEAGQIGGQQMLELLSSFRRSRVGILSGDTHQHEAVEASDALRAIEQYSGLGYAELTNIRRSKSRTAKTSGTPMAGTIQARRNEAQQGKLGASFDRLDKQGAVVACHWRITAETDRAFS